MTKRTLGAVVKEARDGARMTQRELAAAVGRFRLPEGVP
jgi:hypothetical protein